MEVELLQQILAAQKEQNALLRQHLGRFKFSIRGLLVLMTLLCVGLAAIGYRMSATGARVVYPAPAMPVGAGTFQDPYAPPPMVVPTTNPNGTPNTAGTRYEMVPASRVGSN